MNTVKHPERAPFSKDLEPLRQKLVELLPSLEKNPDWYGSIYFERKVANTYAADFQKTNLSDHITQGVVLRIYNGYSLYEQATDDISDSGLSEALKSLVQRVESVKDQSQADYRPYQAPTWEERLSRNLDDEIRSQVPAQLDPMTPVHFGIRYRQDPVSPSPEERLTHLKHLIDRCQVLAPQCGLERDDLSFVSSRQTFSVEESIFIDRESNLSQTLYRIALFLIVMSGQDQTSLRWGGLGGMEAIQTHESEIESLLRDLSALKKAERLKPGKYRVLFSPSITGVLAHEAFGHSQEGDTCARGRSQAWELYQSGELAGNEHATILNNPAAYTNGEGEYAAWGSYFFDEEGWLAESQTLIDGGKLQSPMTNLTSAIRLNVPRTANGKRESWASGVYTRQTNTYFSPGEETFDELMAKIPDGFLATECAGGMEDPKGMGIQVGISHLKEVKEGKLTGRIFKGPAGGEIQMTGYTPDVLKSIVGKSKIAAHSQEPDQIKHPFNEVGGCGKYHKEFVNAGCGGPYLLLDNVILG